MRRILLFLLTCFLLSCGSGDPSSGKWGKWEQDNDGNKYREDYALRDKLNGYELVKYTRIDGGQFGGGSSSTKFTLCSDGSMKFYHQSSTTVSVDGAGGSDASEEEDYGTWKAVETADGYKLLMTQSTKYNKTGFFEIKLMDSKIQIVRNNEWEEFLMKKIDC